MSQPVIKVEGLWKEYTIGAAPQRHARFYDLIADTLSAPLRRMRKLSGQAQASEQFWALRDINFEVQAGEVLGIIGRNGAGKSTLLKILSRITAPTRGSVTVRGRMSSLLEVGTGFHPELTGRENVFLNGAILGMTRTEIQRNFDEIVDFSGVEKFIDTPVKHFSSGMYVRLAFAVAAHLEPEILVVDEVLAVGDVQFQKKCLGKMEQVGKQGRTVLFVSHNSSAIRQLCSTGLLLKDGAISSRGTVSDVLSRYADSGQKIPGEKIWGVEDAPGTGDVRLRRLSVFQNRVPVVTVQNDRPLELEIEVHALRPLADVDIGIVIFNSGGEKVLHTATCSTVKSRRFKEGANVVSYVLPPYLLNSGTYSVKVACMIPNRYFFFEEQDVIGFSVQASSGLGSTYSESSWSGTLSPEIGHWRGIEA